MLLATTVLATFAFASPLTPQEWDTAWDQAEKECEHIMTMENTDKSILPSLDDIQRTAKCFVSCFFDSVGLTNGTEIDRDLYRGWLGEEIQDAAEKETVIASVDECVDGIEKTEKCNTAYDLYACFGKKFFMAGMEGIFPPSANP